MFYHLQGWKVILYKIIVVIYNVVALVGNVRLCLQTLPIERLEYESRRLSKMTIYEIISIAINLAILLLELLSYLRNSRSNKE